MWCVGDLDAEYITKMEDVLALYEKPYNPREPVLCLDEKPVSLHADVRAPRPARPGHLAKRDNEYRRCGTANVFAVVEPKAGSPLHLRHTEPVGGAVRPRRAARGGRVSARAHHSSRDGQSQHPLRAVTHRPPNASRWPTALAALDRTFHAEAWQLAQSSRDRTESCQSRLLGSPPPSVVAAIPPRDQRLDRTGEPRSHAHSVAVYTQRCPHQVCVSKTTL